MESQEPDTNKRTTVYCPKCLHEFSGEDDGHFLQSPKCIESVTLIQTRAAVAKRWLKARGHANSENKLLREYILNRFPNVTPEELDHLVVSRVGEVAA